MPKITTTYFIKTYGCAANEADSEHLAAVLEAKGLKLASSIETADVVYINTCIVRQSAENRTYGLVNNLGKLKETTGRPRVIITGCLAGLAVHDYTGKISKLLKKRLPSADEFIYLDQAACPPTRGVKRKSKDHALVPISNGCSNFCSYCVVPYARGSEVSRPFQDIVAECKCLIEKGYIEITLLGQNVNSYGIDLKRNPKYQATNSKQIQNLNDQNSKHKENFKISSTPTLFPYLIEAVAQMGFQKVDFLSANPWDFSDELINVISRNKNICRIIHLPVQSGDNEILKRMRRAYTREEFLGLVKKIRAEIDQVEFTTDIIVGFPGETEDQFENTIDLVKEVGFTKAYIALYSPRPLTLAAKLYEDNIPREEKKRRWRILDALINKKT
ncbi:MiaB/RimO family radical SAM methylthiotransferase [Patescibacteria group bacterium]|nr:MiaB/RimO family radical SAM methylthiotransferase [Patescibacteria group bacterium]